MTRGRNINEQDTATSVRVVTVSEFFAKQYFPEVDPLTQRISFPEIISGAAEREAGRMADRWCVSRRKTGGIS